jgi:hypothetical protein
MRISKDVAAERQEGDELGSLGTDPLESISLTSDLFGVWLGHAVGARVIDAAVLRLIGISKEVRAVRLLQGSQLMYTRQDSPHLCESVTMRKRVAYL